MMLAQNPEYVVNKRTGVPYDVYVGRPSKFGNPFVIGVDGDREQVLIKYTEWLLSQPELVVAVRRELKGKVLACWCAPEPCHADILAQIANS